MSLIRGIDSAFKSLDCAIYSGGAYIAGGIGRYAPATAEVATNTINALRRLRGCDPVDDVVAPPSPFTGGQCDGVCYRIGITSQGIGSGPSTNFYFTRGPITGIRVVGPSSGATIEVFCRAPGQTNFCPTAQDPGWYSGFGGGGVTDASIASTERPDNLPDDCGDPPPVYPPPTSITIDVDVEYTDEGDNVLNVTIPFTFAPFDVDFNGDFLFPFEFDFGGFEFTGNVSFDPTFNLNIRPKAIPPPTTDAPLEPGPPEDEVDRVPPEEKIIGVVVTSEIDQQGRVGQVDFTGGPDIIIPRAASVKFAYSLGVATFWSSDIDVKTLRAFIPCPFSQGADAVVVTPYIGLSSTAIPIKGQRLATVGDLQRELDA